jgi:hypothetical protein
MSTGTYVVDFDTASFGTTSTGTVGVPVSISVVGRAFDPDRVCTSGSSIAPTCR